MSEKAKIRGPGRAVAWPKRLGDWTAEVGRWVEGLQMVEEEEINRGPQECEGMERRAPRQRGQGWRAGSSRMCDQESWPLCLMFLIFRSRVRQRSSEVISSAVNCIQR